MNAISINLAPKRKKNAGDKLLYFILNYFRYIIVVTQIIVISVFFYRLMQDQKIVDLEKNVRQNQRLLEIMEPLVEEAKALEVKTKNIESVISEQDLFLKRTNLITTSIPDDVSLNEMSIVNSSVELSGVSKSVSSIKALNQKLNKSQYVVSSTIVNLVKELDEQYIFSLLVEFKQNN